jgi:hypothetical protein
MKVLSSKTPPTLLAAPITYLYHVVYFYQTKRGETGNGTMQIQRNLPISNCEQINSVMDFIKQETGFAKVGLLNWILL